MDDTRDPVRDIFGERDPRARLRAQGLAYMLTGAGYAAAVFAGALLFIGALVVLGRFLPEESKQAPDPLLRGERPAIEAPLEAPLRLA